LRRLTVDDVHVGYDAGTGQITRPSALRRLKPAFAADEESSASVVARKPAPVVRVPAGSVVVGANQTTCVYPDRV
jgi:hypothetical protein